ncbi:hypothetical protein BS47DRAFT_1391905 [Hydnum rufescens UP504]|uniref:Zn(2)-C6 fungal-type domain-containing protein n=1 Tax=Hydnum rufescens UP504 TaxID=1448309 RepID=A0A9P6B015_9AGAM|nr:hypothetical protein BS47DRAFT_1391905 [Hydnum rufescens UP504]
MDVYVALVDASLLRHELKRGFYGCRRDFFPFGSSRLAESWSHGKMPRVASANPRKRKPGAPREESPPGPRDEAQKQRQGVISTPSKCTNCEKSGSQCIVEGRRRSCRSCYLRKVKCVQAVAEDTVPEEHEPSSEVQIPKSSPSPSKEPPQRQPQTQPRTKIPDHPDHEKAKVQGTKRKRTPESDAGDKRPKPDAVNSSIVPLVEVRGAIAATEGVLKELVFVEILFEGLFDFSEG